MSSIASAAQRRAILAADDARMKAMISCDIPALEKLLAEDVIYTHNNGGTDTKKSYLASQAPGHYRSLTRMEDVVYVNGPTAWMHGRIQLELVRDGKVTLRDSRFISVWVEEEGAWRMAIWTGTPIIPPPARPV